MHGWEYLRDEDRDLILEGVRLGKALGGPFHAEIDPIDVCNADCFFCCSQELRAGDVLPWERLGPLVDELIAGGLRSVRLAGGGEPLLYPALRQLCDKLAEGNVVLDNITTNAIRLNDAALDSLMRLRTSHWYVSLNYATRERYETHMRVPANRFDWIIENFARLDTRLRAEGKREEGMIHAQFMIHRSTVEDLPLIADLCDRMPVDGVVIRALGYVDPAEALGPEDVARFKELMPDTVRRLMQKAWVTLEFEAYGAELNAWCLELQRQLREEFAKAAPYVHGPAYPDPQWAEIQGIEYCVIGWHSITIQGNGDTHACCMLMHDDAVPPYGNVRHEGIQQVWHGAMYQRHRQEMREAMLMEGHTPGQRRRFVCTVEACWAHDRCPLSNQMADGSFYSRLHETLEKLRRRPLAAAMRLGNQMARLVAGSRR